MAMQESPKSLRTYFVIAGLWAGYAHLNQLTVPMQLVVRVFNYIGLATAVGFLVIGSQLPKWLTTKTEAIGLFLLANVGVAVAASLWDLNAGAASLGTAISLGLTVLISLYLRTQLKRLAQQAPISSGTGP